MIKQKNLGKEQFMKKFISILMAVLCFVMVGMLAACNNGNNQTPPDGNIPDTDRPIVESANTLVVYFSMPDNVDNSTVVIDGETLGNTQYMAYVIQENANANIFRIIPETPYPTDHSELVDLAREEQRNNARPAFQGEIENFDSYDTVFVGYPNWWGDMPMIMYTFFDTYDFTGKKIITFNTHGGSGFSSTNETIARLEANAEVVRGLSISRNNIQNAEQQIIDWLKGLGFEKSETPVVPEHPTTPDNSENEQQPPIVPDQPTTSETPDDPNADTNILIVYFTAESGNTEKLANYIQSQIGGDIIKIEAAQPYTSQELNYSIKNNRPEVEKAENARPLIAQTTYDQIDISKYDTVFIGYPIWWWTAPMIIGTFLEYYEWTTDYDIYPFSQSASMNTTHFTTSMEFVRDCAIGATVHDGLFARASSTTTIDSYLRTNGFVG